MANEPFILPACPPCARSRSDFIPAAVQHRVDVTIAALNTEIALLFARDGKLKIG